MRPQADSIASRSQQPQVRVSTLILSYIFAVKDATRLRREARPVRSGRPESLKEFIVWAELCRPIAPVGQPVEASVNARTLLASFARRFKRCADLIVTELKHINRPQVHHLAHAAAGSQ